MPSVNASSNDQALYNQLTSQNGGTSSTSRNKLTSDLNTFLTLLTKQLKYQDPTNPMDTAQFTQQLVQYSQVEQQISTNEKLDKLLTATNGSLGATAVQYIGNYIEAESSKLPLQDGKARFAYGIASNADTVGIMIQDADGKTVYSASGELTAGVHEFRWDGKDSAGNQLPDGTYSISVTALGKEGSIDSYTTVFGRVTGVTSQNGEVVLVMDKVAAPMSQILSVSKTWDQAPAQLAGSAIQYMGSKVEVSSDDLPLQSAKGEYSYTLPEIAKSVAITIKDSTGKTVATKTADVTDGKVTAGKHTMTWDGKDNDGNQLPDGAYTISIKATSPLEYEIKGISTTVTGLVTGVTTKSGEAAISMGSVTEPVSKILSANRA